MMQRAAAPTSFYRAIMANTLAIVIATLLLMSQLFDGQPFETSLKLGFVLLVLLSVWRMGGIGALLAVQAYLFLTETKTPVSGWHAYVVLPALTLSLVIFIERLRAIRATARQYPRPTTSTWREWAEAAKSRLLPRDSQPTVPLEGSEVGRHVLAVATLFAGALASALVAGWMLRSVPLDFRAPDSVRLRPTELRGIVLASVLMAVMIAVFLVVGELTWRKLSPKQARVYLRDHFARWIETDWLAMHRQRVKARQRTWKRRQLNAAQLIEKNP